jgi:hypothetical protein
MDISSSLISWVDIFLGDETFTVLYRLCDLLWSTVALSHINCPLLGGVGIHFGFIGGAA